MHESQFIISADWIIVDPHTAYDPGWVHVVGSRIQSVGAGPIPGVFSRSNRAAVVSLGRCVVVAGWVNAHTHLELSGFAGRVPPACDFPDWLGRLTREMRKEAETETSIRAAVDFGGQQSLRHGVTTVGDVTRRPAVTRSVVQRTNLSGTSFGEVIAIGTQRGFLHERIDMALKDNTDFFDSVHSFFADKATPTGDSKRADKPSDAPVDANSLRVGAVSSMSFPSKSRWRFGVSPHSPYTVEPDGLRQCVQAARMKRAPMCIHLLESPDESTFTRLGEGPLADHLRAVGVWDDQIVGAGIDPVELCDQVGVLGPATILAHANYASDSQIRLISARGAHVAYCPRTHAAFGHPPHRFEEMLADGVNVCLGTDSLASNPSLSILDELRFLYRQRPHLASPLFLELGTIRGAKALGLANECGALRPGLRADLAVYTLPARARGWEWLLETDDLPVRVLTGGVWNEQSNDHG